MPETPSIDVRELNFRYPGCAPTLRDVCLSVEAGETVAIVGPSGAGKSTLLLHLNGLLPATAVRDAEQATVFVNGTPVIREHLASIRKEVGFLFQNPDDQLFCPTVGRDVAFGPLNLGLARDIVSARVSETLEAVGLSGFEDRDTLQLSVGERKRVCLAAVLACQPKVLVLDEPFSNLDPRNRRELSTILKDFEGTQLLATHDLDRVVDLSDRVLLIDEGQLRADGATRTILADRTLMHRHGLEVPHALRSGSSTTKKVGLPTTIVAYNSDDGSPQQSVAASSPR